MEDIKGLFNYEYMINVINGDSVYPGGILGAHLTDRGFVVTVYNPRAAEVAVIEKRSSHKFQAEKIDEAGLFVAYLGCDSTTPYYLEITPYEGQPYTTEDCYRFPVQTTSEEAYLFGSGTLYNVSEVLGAHIKTIDGITGTLFTVWAPNAARVSVVGDFNQWDGRIHQMNKVYDVGIFELFIPGITEGALYKYEIKTSWGALMMKTDPFGNYQQKRPDTASIVTDVTKYKWTDEKWLEKRKNTDIDSQPVAIYEVHLGSWRKKGENKDEFLTYRELAPQLAEYVKQMGYTHIELMGISEHPFDGSWGYQVTGYYAPTSRFGSPEDFQYFVDYMHNQGISVVLDWVPAHFPKDAHGLARFDGTPLYEHPDSRRGEHPDWGTYIFNYGKTEVCNFLIGSALFWIEKFHIDGLRVDAVASMLYLDYGKQDGQWLPNIYGGRENLEAIQFLKHLNSVNSKRNPGSAIMAEESTSFPGVTAKTEDDGLGFTFKWNMGWMNDFLKYMSTDPIYRCHDHNELTFSMVYATSEKFILVLSHDEVVYGKCSMINKMPGDDWQKFANLKAAYGFMFGHPGKKLLFMGQDFAQYDEWNSNKELDWFLIDQVDNNRMLQNFVRDLLTIYKKYPALYEQDFTYDGFQWINCDDWSHSEVSFIRKPKTPGEKYLMFICNFVPVPHENFLIGVPCNVEYKLVLNSDDKKYGGTGSYVKETLIPQEEECDNMPYCVRYSIPPLSVSVFEFDYVDPEVQKAKEKAEKEKAEKEKAEREKAEREKAEREKAEKEKAEREKAEREKAEKEKAEREKAEKEKTEKEKAEKEKAEKKTATPQPVVKTVEKKTESSVDKTSAPKADTEKTVTAAKEVSSPKVTAAEKELPAAKKASDTVSAPKTAQDEKAAMEAKREKNTKLLKAVKKSQTKSKTDSGKKTDTKSK